MKRSIAMLGMWAVLAVLACAPARAAPPPLQDLLRAPLHEIIVLSPSGKYVAATLRKTENGKSRVVLVIIDRVANKPVRLIDPQGEGEIAQVAWLNDERLLVRRAWQGGSVQQYYRDPLVVAVNVDGTRKRTFYAAIVDTLADDDDHILIARCVRNSSRGCWSTVQQVDNDAVRRGSRLVESPEVDSGFITDNAGQVRFATHWDDDNRQRLWLRRGDAWEVLNDEAVTGVAVHVVGSSRDSASAFLWSERKDGPDVIERYEIATGRRDVVMHDARRDPDYILYSADRRQPIGAAYGPGVPQPRFWDDQDPDARLLRAIQKQFPDDSVWFHSGSRDGQHLIVGVDSDRDPGSYYLFDRASKRMDLVARNRPWLDPAALARSEPIAYTARDGLALEGYLTMPLAAARPPPLVVLPHGGPFGIRDAWEYEEETQILAAHGYAVLRVNFRGSSGRGQGFERAGYRQWGLKIMDDITDGTRWAIASGRIDPSRICIWGTSFGGYAALMGVAREPDLYRCAVSTAGATNLVTTRSWGDTQRSRSGRAYLDEAVGTDPALLFDQSPVKFAAGITAPVLLVHGNHDPRVSFEHARAMVAAMRKAGRPMETFFFGDETHGIYGEDNRRLYYTRVLAFLEARLKAPAPGAAP